MPAVDGLHFRNPYGEQDADAILAFHARRAAHDAVDPFALLESIPTGDEIRAALAKAAAAQQLDHRLVAEVNGQVVGYSEIESWHEEDDRWVYLIRGWILPERRGIGLGTAMLHWGEERARRLAAAEHPGELFEFAGTASSSDLDAAALLLHEGYAVGYTDLEMDLDPAAPLPEIPLPPGIEVRPALAEHIPLIAESIAESYRSEFPGSRFRNTMVEVAGQAEWYSSPVHDRSLWQVAWEVGSAIGASGGGGVGAANPVGTIAGQVLPMMIPGRGVIDEVSVRPAWRRRGLARALLLRGLRELRARGVTVVRLTTGAEFRTRARDLYTSVGFRIVREFPSYRKSPNHPSASRVKRSKAAARLAYDRLSGWYDLLAGSEEAFNRRALDVLEIHPEERVLEIGFGTGHSLAYIARHGCQVVGIDLSLGMARVARRWLQKEGLRSGVFLSLGDGARLPYPDGCFDVVFTAFTLELFDTPEIPVVLQEIRRVLRPGGRIGLVALSLPVRPGKLVRVYEWFHKVMPAYVDCRPIPAEGWLRQGGFLIDAAECKNMWGLPVEIVVGVKNRL